MESQLYRELRSRGHLHGGARRRGSSVMIVRTTNSLRKILSKLTGVGGVGGNLHRHATKQYRPAPSSEYKSYTLPISNAGAHLDSASAAYPCTSPETTIPPPLHQASISPHP